MFGSLEKAILKYRTNEMMRLLFHIEDLRKFLIGSMRASNLVLEESDDRFFNERSKGMPQVWKRAVDDNILTEAEVNDIKKIIEKRNTIAHEIQKFTQDLHKELKEYSGHNRSPSEYDYGALKRFLEYKSRLQGQWSGILELNFRSIYFEHADEFYKEENIKLSKRINRLTTQRKKLVDSVNDELSSINFTNYEEHPKNAANYKENGHLTKRGIDTCRSLLRRGLSCFAVSILMDISLKKVKYHKRKLEERI